MTFKTKTNDSELVIQSFKIVLQYIKIKTIIYNVSWNKEPE